MNKLEKFLYRLVERILPTSEVEDLASNLDAPLDGNQHLVEYVTELASKISEPCPPPPECPPCPDCPDCPECPECPPETETPPPSGEVPPPEDETPPVEVPPFDIRQMSVGINLSEHTYYATQLAFVDVVKSGRKGSSAPWDGSSGLSYDSSGYPRSVSGSQYAWTLVLRGLDGKYPAGTWTLMFEGDGDVRLNYDATGTFNHNGQGIASFPVNVSRPTTDGVEIRITRSSSSNPVRNIRFVMPGHKDTFLEKPFNPVFLEMIEPFTTLRFMDWGSTNNSGQVNWSDRTSPYYYSFQGDGVPYEYMALLCNQTKKHMWVCVPHKASNTYVSELAKVIKSHLDPSLKCFIEYSNEVWNGGFSQHRDVASAASNKGFQWYQQYTIRSVEIFKIFEREFGGLDRLVRVLGSQSANSWIGEQILKALPSRDDADALAIAPYFGGKLGSSLASSARGWSVDEVINWCSSDIDTVLEHVSSNKSKADAHGVALIGYEGGQHLAGVGSSADDGTLTNLFMAANRDVRMSNLYQKYLNGLKDRGCGVFALFNDCYRPTKWGSWGLLEYQGIKTPKYNGTMEFISSL